MCAMCGRLLAIVRQLTCYVSFVKTLLQIRSDQSALPPAAQATRDPLGARAALWAQEVRPVRRGVTILRIVLRRRWLRRGRRRTASWNGTVEEEKRTEEKEMRRRCGGSVYCLLSTVYCLLFSVYSTAGHGLIHMETWESVCCVVVCVVMWVCGGGGKL